MSKTKLMIEEDYERVPFMEHMYIMEKEAEMQEEFERIPAKINLTLQNGNNREILHSDQAGILA